MIPRVAIAKRAVAKQQVLARLVVAQKRLFLHYHSPSLLDQDDCICHKHEIVEDGQPSSASFVDQFLQLVSHVVGPVFPISQDRRVPLCIVSQRHVIDRHNDHSCAACPGFELFDVTLDVHTPELNFNHVAHGSLGLDEVRVVSAYNLCRRGSEVTFHHEA